MVALKVGLTLSIENFLINLKMILGVRVNEILMINFEDLIIMPLAEFSNLLVEPKQF